MKTSDASPGYILPIVLFLIVVLTAGALFALHIARQDLIHTAMLVDSAEAQIEAESQLEILKYYAASGRFLLNRIQNDSLKGTGPAYPGEFYIDGREHNLSDTVQIRLQDSAGLLNAMYPDGDAIASLLEQSEGFDVPYVLRDSLADWLDIDTFHRLNGAEEEYYRSHKLAYAPRNAFLLTSPAELRLVRGLRDLNEAQRRYLDRFLILSPISAFNFTTAPMELIASRLHVSPKELDGLRELRDENLDLYLSRLRTIGTGYDPETTSLFPSRVLRVEIRTRRGDATRTLRAVVDFNEYDDAPLHTISVR